MEFNFTEHEITRRTGYGLAVTFPTWEKDAAGVISFHDELERLGRDWGWENVIGTLYVEEDELLLGIFVNKNEIIDVNSVERRLPNPHSSLPPA